MRTVEQLVKDYERYNWTRHITEKPFWGTSVDLAQRLQDARFIVTQIYTNGAVRLATPDWYKLNPTRYNSNDLLTKVIDVTYGYRIEYIRIHEQGIVVKVSEN